MDAEPATPRPRRKLAGSLLRALIAGLAAAGLVWLLVPVQPRHVLHETENEWPEQFSDDGRVLATTTRTVSYMGQAWRDNRIRLWDARRGRELNCNLVHRGWSRIALSPDGSKIAISHPKSGVTVTDSPVSSHMEATNPETVVYQIDAEKLSQSSGKADESLPVIARIPDHEVAAFAPDGRRLVVWSTSAEPAAAVWDVDQNREVATLPAAVGNARFSADGRIVVTESPRTGVRDAVELKVWDATTGKLFGTIPNAEAGWDWSVDPRGKTVASGRVWDGSPRQVRVWSVEPWQQVATINDAGSPVYTPDGKTLVCLGGERIEGHLAMIWDTERWVERSRVRMDPLSEVSNLKAHPDGHSVLYDEEVYEGSSELTDQICRLDLNTLRTERLFVDHITDIDCVAARAPLMVVKSWKGPNTSVIPWMIHIWDLPPRKPMGVVWALAGIAALVACALTPLQHVSRAIARRIVMPGPPVRRTFGTFNVLFGLILLLLGGGLLALLAGTDLVGDFELNRGSGDVYMLFDLISMVLLNALLFISGCGLLAARPWAAPMGVMTALLKLMRLVIVTIWFLAEYRPWNQYTLAYALTVGVLGSIYPLLFLATFFRWKAAESTPVVQ